MVRDVDLQAFLVELEMVDLALAGDDRLAQAVVGVDDQTIELPAHRVDREPHSRPIAGNLPLNHDGHAGLMLQEALMMAVMHGPVAPERDEGIANPFDDRINSDDIEIRVMLAREGGLSEVFERGRRPDGERAAARRSQTIECLADGRLDVCGQRVTCASRARSSAHWSRSRSGWS